MRRPPAPAARQLGHGTRPCVVCTPTLLPHNPSPFLPGGGVQDEAGSEGGDLEGLRLRPGLAMSQDGRNWARIEADHHSGALFDVGQPGEWDELFIGGPQVGRAGRLPCWSCRPSPSGALARGEASVRGRWGPCPSCGARAAPLPPWQASPGPEQACRQASAGAWPNTTTPMPAACPPPHPRAAAGRQRGPARHAPVLPLIRPAQAEVCGGAGHLARRLPLDQAGTRVRGGAGWGDGTRARLQGQSARRWRTPRQLP